MEPVLLTGQVAELLEVTEPRLNDLIRRQKIEPVPPVVGGRRLWSPDHVEAAARALGGNAGSVAR